MFRLPKYEATAIIISTPVCFEVTTVKLNDIVLLMLQIKKHTLTFKSLSVRDRGNYTCVVKNDHGRLEFTYNVGVTGW